MSDQSLSTEPLPIGKLAPSFELQSVAGETITRNQYRNRNALLIIFFIHFSEVQSLFAGMGHDSAEYDELNVRVLAIGRLKVDELAAIAAQVAPLITLLADLDGKAWNAYTNQGSPGYAAFMLDLYGGVDAQIVCRSAAELPDAKTLLGWARAAQYRCNI